MTEITEGNYADEALMVMKSRAPNADGTIGVTIKSDMPEWPAWQAYFLGKRMDNRASFMRSRARDGYMVPCRSPADFDPFGIAKARQEYAARMHNGEIGTGEVSRHSREIPFVERTEIADAVKEAVKGFGVERKRTADMRDAKPAPLEPKPLTEAEAASLRRIAGIPEQKDEAA